MKTIEVDEDLYRYIAGQTERIGESAEYSAPLVTSESLGSWFPFKENVQAKRYRC